MHKEIAADMGFSDKQVRDHYYRALDILRAVLAKWR